MTILTLLFYLCAVFFILHEFISMNESERLISFIEFNDIYQKENGYKIPMIEWSQKMKNLAFIQAAFFIYSIIGLMSSQMLIFFLIILLSMFKKKTSRIMKFTCFLRMILLMFILMNKYQLHINVIHLLI